MSCSDVICVVFYTDDDLEGYDKLATGRRKTGRVREDYSNLHIICILLAVSLCLLFIFFCLSQYCSITVSSVFLAFLTQMYVCEHVQWNRRNEKGETSLHRACIEGNLKQVHYLIEQVS